LINIYLALSCAYLKLSHYSAAISMSMLSVASNGLKSRRMKRKRKKKVTKKVRKKILWKV